MKKYTASAEVYNPSQKPELLVGTIPVTNDLTDGSVILPDDYLSLFGFKDGNDAIGKTITINIVKAFSTDSIIQQFQSGDLTKIDPTKFASATKELTYTVSAVSKKSTAALSQSQLSILFSSKDSRDIYDFESKDTTNYGKYLAVLVHVKDGKDTVKLQAARNELEKQGYFVKTSKDLQATLNQVVDIFTALVGVFGIITLLASVFGIVNTQYISVLERTREIGLMKSLGMRSRDVRSLFMIEAGWIGFIGGLIGTIAGIALAVSLNPWIDKKWGIQFMFKPVQVAGLIIVLIVIAILAGFFPARKAAKLDPIVALRTE
jgi:putative ABC transport system permease protein